MTARSTFFTRSIKYDFILGHKNLEWIFLVAWIFLLSVLSCCLENSPEIKITTTTTENLPKENLTLSVLADKEVYHSGDKINISARIESSVFIEDAIVKVYGIYADTYRIHDQQGIVLYPGVREIPFAFTTPRCYGCAGISPGIYNVTVEIVDGDKVLKSKTIKVEIKQ